MSEQKQKIDLIAAAIADSLKSGKEPELQGPEEERRRKKYQLDLEDIKPKGQQVQYASVKLRVELFERIKEVAQANGIRQPGKFISLILENFLDQLEKGENES